MEPIKIKALLFATALLGLTACLKKDRLNIDTDQGPKNIVEFANTGNNVSAATSTYPRYNADLGRVATGEKVEFNVNLSYSGADAAPQDIKVDLALDTALLTKFNTENGTKYVVPPTAIYTMPASAVIKQGSTLAQVKVAITNNASFDFGKSYALPIKIASASIGTVSANFGKAVYSFGARNIYDGMYSYSGTITRNSATGPDLTLSGSFTNLAPRALATLSGNSVSLTPLWANGTGIAGIDGTYITVDPATNLVTMASTGNATLKNTPGTVNKYDPATKTFTLAFDWGTAPNTRITTMTLTYTGPR